jgi:hypothetical protein
MIDTLNGVPTIADNVHPVIAEYGAVYVVVVLSGLAGVAKFQLLIFTDVSEDNTDVSDKLMSDLLVSIANKGVDAESFHI